MQSEQCPTLASLPCFGRPAAGPPALPLLKAQALAFVLPLVFILSWGEQAVCGLL